MKIKRIFCLFSFAQFMIAGPAAADNDVDRLIAAMLALTPVIDGTNLKQQMKNFAVWGDWANGTRGRHQESVNRTGADAGCR